MRKKIVLISLVLVCALLITLFVALGLKLYFDSKLDYPYGIDTVIAFGNGRFSILEDYEVSEKVKKGLEKVTNLNTRKYYSLVDNKKQDNIEKEVFKIRETKPYIYTVGKQGYTKLNYEIGDVKQSAKLGDFSATDQQIFKEESKFKVLIKNK